MIANLPSIRAWLGILARCHPERRDDQEKEAWFLLNVWVFQQCIDFQEELYELYGFRSTVEAPA